MTDENKQPSVAVITDWRNHALEESVMTQAKTGDFRIAFPGMDLQSQPLHHNLSDREGFQELVDTFNKGYQAVIISVGVPEMTQDYAHKIHRLLEAWRHARKKPVVLLTSSNPNKDTIIDLVNTWPGWDKMPDSLGRAILISKNDLTRVEALIPTLQDSLRIANELKTELAKPTGDAKPTLGVRAPDISENAEKKAVDPVGV